MSRYKHRCPTKLQKVFNETTNVEIISETNTKPNNNYTINTSGDVSVTFPGPDPISKHRFPIQVFY